MKITFASDTSFAYLNLAPSIENAKEAMEEPAKIMANSDFGMINLENIFTPDCGNDEFAPITKSGPNLISDKNYMEYINVLSPKIVGLANNHTGDFGDAPIAFTKNLLEQKGYIVVGAGKNTDEAYKPAILSKDGTEVAIIAACENEFGTAGRNSYGSAGFSLEKITEGILEAVKNGRKPIVWFHGGNEGNPFPSPKKTELYRHFINIGAEAVIAMHTHCPQGIEYHNGKPIVYSMGNFFFPYENCRPIWYHGYMVSLNIDCGKTDLEIFPYKFDSKRISMLKGEEKDNFMKYMAHISAPISSPEKTEELFDVWCMTQEHYIDTLAQYKKGMLYNADQKDIVSIKNLFGCEAHNELLTNMFKMIYDGKTQDAQKKTYIFEKLSKMEITEL